MHIARIVPSITGLRTLTHAVFLDKCTYIIKFCKDYNLHTVEIGNYSFLQIPRDYLHKKLLNLAGARVVCAQSGINHGSIQ